MKHAMKHLIIIEFDQLNTILLTRTIKRLLKTCQSAIFNEIAT